MNTQTSSADVCTTSRRPGYRKPRAVAMPSPDIPGPAATNADFWRAVFLCDLAAMGAGKKMIAKAHPFDGPALRFLYEGIFHQTATTKDSFANWMEACGGLAGNAEGGAT